MNSASPVAMRIGAPTDRFFLLMVVYNGEGGDPIKLYLSTKDFSASDDPALGNQYKHVNVYRVNNGGVPFAYLYWSIDTDPRPWRKYSMNQESEKFFGPIMNIYESWRSVFDMERNILNIYIFKILN